MSSKPTTAVEICVSRSLGHDVLTVTYLVYCQDLVVSLNQINRSEVKLKVHGVVVEHIDSESSAKSPHPDLVALRRG
jgi:hypothetical protein